MADPTGAFLTPEQLALLQAQAQQPVPSGAFIIPGRVDPELGLTNIPETPSAPDITTGSILASMPRRMLAAEQDAITRKRMYGVPLSPEEETAVAASDRYKAGVGEPTARRIFDAGATDAIGQAIDDPSLATITNAGGRTALAALRPATALGIMGGGLGLAALDQAGLSPIGPASASDEDGLSPQQRIKLQALEKKIRSGSFANNADRRATEQELQGLRSIQSEFAKTQMGVNAERAKLANASQQKDYDDAVAKAKAARAREEARDVRFADTPVGKVWTQTGGLAPMALGGITGLMSRMATGPGQSAAGKFVKDYAMPMTLGTVAGAAANNVPLANDAFLTPVLNPEREAIGAYARELPPDHPRKREFADYAATLPRENPTRTAASAELYDPVKLRERVIMGGLEGLLGGGLGSDIPRAAGRALFGGSKAAAPRPPIVQSGLDDAANAMRLSGEATRLAPPSVSGAFSAQGQSPATLAGPAGQAPAAVPQLTRSSESLQNPLLSPPSSRDSLQYASDAFRKLSGLDLPKSVALTNNTATVSPTQARTFQAGVKGEPVSGKTVHELVRDQDVVAAVDAVVKEAGARKIQGPHVERAMESLGREIRPAQAGRVAKRLDEALGVARQREMMRKSALKVSKGAAE